MNPRRLLIALLAALLLSGAVTYFLSRRINGRSAVANAVPTQKLVAVSRPVQPGEILKPEGLTLLDWPARMPLDGAFTRIEEVSGRAVIYPLAARQPVVAGYLAVAGSGIGLTTRIPEGMRAISVRSDEVIGVAGFLFPGSHVDVLVTFRTDTLPTPTTQIVLQDVEVLTAGQKIEPEPGGKAETVGVVTVLLKPDEAEKMVLASTQGAIHFVLRNGADRGRVVALPVRVTEIAGPARSGGALTPAPAPVKHPFEVETIMGDKHVTSQFE